MTWLVRAGAVVFTPLFTHPDYDMIADFGDHIDRVQVNALGGGSLIVVGGPRYAAYEVEPGEALQARPPPAGRGQMVNPTLN